MRPVTVMLKDPAHRFPVPDKIGLFLEKDDRLQIDADDPTWVNLIDDGSVMIVPETEPDSVPQAAADNSATDSKGE